MITVTYHLFELFIENNSCKLFWLCAVIHHVERH
ncbi:hypothetical protein ROV85_23 [Pantoea phage ROV85]